MKIPEEFWAAVGMAVLALAVMGGMALLILVSPDETAAESELTTVVRDGEVKP